MAQIKNQNYRQFLDKGMIKILEVDHLEKALSNITGKHKRQARALLIALYFTGARPNEVLKLKAEDIFKERSYIIVNIEGSKRGLPRPIYLQSKNKFIKEFWLYVKSLHPSMFLFWKFKSQYIRKVKGKEYIETTDKLRFHFKKWFENVLPESIPPYYLRHNRFSKLMLKEASLDELRLLKGCKDLRSVSAYQHFNVKLSKKLAKKID